MASSSSSRPGSPRFVADTEVWIPRARGEVRHSSSLHRVPKSLGSVLPPRSPTRRSFPAGRWSRRSIEKTGSRGAGEFFLVGERITSTHQASPRALRSLQGQTFFVRSPEQKMRFSPFPAPRLPVIRRSSTRAISETAAPGPSVDLARGRHVSFCKGSCGLAATMLRLPETRFRDCGPACPTGLWCRLRAGCRPRRR